VAISTFEVAVWALAIFFSLYGLLFLILSRHTDPSKDPKFMKTRLFLFLFSLLYFSFAHYAAYTGIVLNIEYGVNPCSTQINMTTSAGNLTSYSYYTSCNTSASEVLSAFQVTYGWLLWLEMATVVLGGMFLFLNWLRKLW
jgi:hypothetical protein